MQAIAFRALGVDDVFEFGRTSGGSAHELFFEHHLQYNVGWIRARNPNVISS